MRKTQSGTWTEPGLGASGFGLRCQVGGVGTVARRQGAAEVAVVLEVDATGAGHDHRHVGVGHPAVALKLEGEEPVAVEGPAPTLLLHVEAVVVVVGVEGLAREASEDESVKLKLKGS